ncbi:MAG: glycolate oxidase subunit GlcF [Betaproteobacteria bacterium]|jgi:glycolate oxidase iron-sulfur subunit|nr:MAG: glycolate oxidase subunit GlcF [Betaproteobacteria bacterium]
MKTNLAEAIRNTPQGQEANAILRACVHCGFCTATCPTYQLLGDELDSPRGRIYLIKEVLEGNEVSAKTQLHLDRCLTCRSCESTCPSGVRYGRLVDIGRDIVDKQVNRSVVESAKRSLLNAVIANQSVFKPLLRIGQTVRPLLPPALRGKVPASSKGNATWPDERHDRKMLVLDGCVQPVLAPEINAAAARVLDHIGISLLKAPAAGCCGAVTFHLNKQQDALDYMRRNIDAWWPLVEDGAEAIVMTASGCATMVRDYGHLLVNDAAYAAKAERVTELTRDLSEIISTESGRLQQKLAASPSLEQGEKPRIAFHSPCSLQHGQQIRGKVEAVLRACGYELSAVPEPHLCCGSAGTYSILQETLSQRLLKNKVAALESGQPVAIATANIGCLTHIRSGTQLPVRHWIELLDERLQPIS